MAHVVKCRACGIKFDTDKLNDDEWIMPKTNWYFHKECYENWVKYKDDPNSDMSSEAWYGALVDYLYRDLKMPVDFAKLQSQWNNFLKPGKEMTPKGVYFSVKYFYDIEHGDMEKAQGGIGIVPSIYRRATQYWADREAREEGIIDAIIAQIKEREARPTKVIHKKTEKKKPKWNLDDIQES